MGMTIDIPRPEGTSKLKTHNSQHRPLLKNIDRPVFPQDWMLWKGGNTKVGGDWVCWVGACIDKSPHLALCGTFTRSFIALRIICDVSSEEWRGFTQRQKHGEHGKTKKRGESLAHLENGN